MSYSHIVTSNYVSVMNLETGEVTKFTSDHPKFADAVAGIKSGNYEAVTKMSVAKIITDYGSKSGDVISVANGVVYYMMPNGEKTELHNTMTTRVLAMIHDGFDAAPLVAFMNNLMSNPSKVAVDELYLFLEETELPITSDGHFIAYKMVNNNYTSIHDGKFMNAVGTVVEMPRNTVDDRRENTCSQGLHFCSKNYLNKYGNGDGDRLLLVKINPADVVSIPSDYNNAKGRAAKYLIWKDITAPGWKQKYLNKDYNEKSVEVIDAPVESRNIELTNTEYRILDSINNFIVDYGYLNEDELDTTFLDLGLDRLDLVKLIMNVEEDLGFDADDIDCTASIGMTVYELIKKITETYKNVTAPRAAVVCPSCGSGSVHKKGFNFDGTKQRYKCNHCGHNFYKDI